MKLHTNAVISYLVIIIVSIVSTILVTRMYNSEIEELELSTNELNNAISMYESMTYGLDTLLLRTEEELYSVIPYYANVNSITGSNNIVLQNEILTNLNKLSSMAGITTVTPSIGTEYRQKYESLSLQTGYDYESDTACDSASKTDYTCLYKTLSPNFKYLRVVEVSYDFKISDAESLHNFVDGILTNDRLFFITSISYTVPSGNTTNVSMSLLTFYTAKK